MSLPAGAYRLHLLSWNTRNDAVSEQFDYEGALRRLIDKRFEANLRGQNSTPEIHELEQWIYAQLRTGERAESPSQSDATQGKTSAPTDDR